MKKISLVMLFLTTTLLQGCMAGAFVAGGAAGTSVAEDKRNLSTMAEDENISYQANQQLALDPTLQEKAHIVVASFNHNVLLAGQAPTAALRDQAEQVVRKVAKIKHIYNQITIDSPTSAYTRSKDALITANVKTRMVATTNLGASQFKVVTENHTVYLLGISSREQANIAATIARNSTGVKRVVKIIEYTKE